MVFIFNLSFIQNYLGKFWKLFRFSIEIYFIPQIAGSYRGSNFSKGGIVLANWPTSGCCSECCAGCCQGCCCGCCPGCSGSCLPLGGVRVLSRGAVQGAPDHVCHWVVSGCCPGSPDHVCHWAVSGCCPGLSRVLSGCSGSCLPLGGVRVLSRVLRIMFAIGWCQGAVQGLRIMFAIGRCQGAVQGCPGCCQGALDHVCHWAVSGCQGAVQGAVQGAPDHVCHWAVSGCCPGCCRVLFRVLRIMFAIGCCPGCCARDKGSKAEPEFNVLISIWGLCWCIYDL